MEPIITNIQKYSIHDGEGIRTTVFFKGCPLECQWCHNPETQNFHQELMFYKERCTGCGQCRGVCPSRAIQIVRDRAVTQEKLCTACGACQDSCSGNARVLAGTTMEMGELVKELEKDAMFYEESRGGVTLSGGEVLAMPEEYIVPLVKKLEQRGISVAIDTCGYVPYEKIQAVLPYVDLFLYDMKAMDDGLHRRYTGKGNARILDNLKRLGKTGKRIWIRVPVIRGVNDSPNDMAALGKFLNREGIPCEKIHLLPYHSTGKSKCERLLGHSPQNKFDPPTDERMRDLAMLLKDMGFQNVVIGG